MQGMEQTGQVENSEETDSADLGRLGRYDIGASRGQLDLAVFLKFLLSFLCIAFKYRIC